MVNPVKTPRQIAFEVCYQLIVNGLSLNDLLDKHTINLASERDRAFCSELCYGFSRYYFVLQAELNKLLKKPLKSRDIDVRIIMLLGLYQLRFMRVEDHAAVNETVKLLHKKKKVWAKGLVNAVLRSFIRNQSDMEKPNTELSAEEQTRAYPEWISRKISEDWGDDSPSVLLAGNQRAPMVLRIAIQQISRKDYLQKLSDVSITAIEHPLVDSAIVLQSPADVNTLPGFSSGLASVQDSSAQIAATLLNCQPGMHVLDACAAPGGKTLHILQSTRNCQLVALDKDKKRLNQVSENLSRASVTAELKCADAAVPESWFDGQMFDRILLDVPCSASGIIRRHPDIRLLRRSEDIAQLVDQQKRLLNAMWSLLKPGGLLLYSTCSIFKDENENQIEQFMSHHENCIELPLKTVQWGIERPVGRQILPGVSNMDGFYYACLEKN